MDTKPVYVVSSDCPRCGSPIYVDHAKLELGETPPPFFTCSCRFTIVGAVQNLNAPQQQLLQEVTVPSVWSQVHYPTSAADSNANNAVVEQIQITTTTTTLPANT